MEKLERDEIRLFVVLGVMGLLQLAAVAYTFTI